MALNGDILPSGKENHRGNAIFHGQKDKYYKLQTVVKFQRIITWTTTDILLIELFTTTLNGMVFE